MSQTCVSGKLEQVGDLLEGLGRYQDCVGSFPDRPGNLLTSSFTLPTSPGMSQDCVGDNLEGVGVSQNCVGRYLERAGRCQECVGDCLERPGASQNCVDWKLERVDL
ncbi:MAG TPA: hypothetical protein VL171_01600 [Verrucomicrobiae bacterium]|nr:hypothetical protein [Verrucomicrobiae bacterium]